MNTTRTCERCRTVLSPAHSRNLCPACLFDTALDPDAIAVASHPPASDAPVEPPSNFGEYELLGELGRGGQGLVFRARHRHLGRLVALKTIPASYLAGPHARERFLLEARTASRLDHPNLVPVYDVGECDGFCFYSMKLIEGSSLDRSGLATPASAAPATPDHFRHLARILRKIALALAHAHQRGVLHRDLKPSNILLDAEHEPYLADFGLARDLDQASTLTAPQAWIGTPAYLAPEIVRHGVSQATTASDIYGLGAILYFLLCGQPPFSGGTLAVTLAAVQHAEPAHPAALHPAIPADLATLCLQCLEKEPARRYASAQDLAADLQRFIEGEPIAARPPTAVYRLQKAFRRHKGAFAAAASVAAALVIGLGVSTWQAIRATREQVRARQVSYGAEISLGFEAIESDNLGRARELLSRQQPLTPSRVGALESNPDSRGWEWRHLWHKTRGDEHVVLAGHEDMVAGVLFLNDGRTIASGGWDNTLRLWDLEKRTNTLTIPLSKGGSRFLCLSPDGHWLAVGGESWQLFDTGSWQPVTTGSSGGASALAFSGDSQRLALIAGSKVRVLDVASRELLANFDRGTMQWERSEKIGLAFSPDGEWLAYGDAEGIIRLSKFADRAELLLRPAQATHSLAFTRDGRYLISGGRSGIDVWNTVTGIPVHHLLGHRDEVAQVTVSRDGSLLASASVDQTVRLWDTTSWKEIRAFRGHHMDVVSVGFSPDGKHLVSAGRDEKLRVWNVEKLPVNKDRFVSPDNAAFHWPFAPGHRIALVHGNLHYAPGIFELSNSRKIADALRRLGDRGGITYLNCMTLEESAPELTPPSFSSAQLMVFGRDARSMAVGWPDGRIELWATQPFRRLSAIGQSTNAPLHLVLSENGQRLAVHRADHTAEVWNPVTGTLELRLPPLANVHGGPNFEFWAQDSILAINVTRGIDLRFLPEGRQRVFPHPKVDVWFHAISNDGRWLATSSWDGLLRLWDVQREQPVEPVEIITGQRIVYYSLVFSPDDSRLIGGGYDGTITIWDMATRQQVAHWKAHDRECAWLRFVGPNQDLISAGNLNNLDRAQGEIRRWLAPSLAEIDARSEARSAALPASLVP